LSVMWPPPARQRFANNLLRSALIVHICCVNKIDTCVEALIHHADRGGFVSLGTESHSAERET